jgi:ATP-dependent RNA helicase DeaD
MIKRPDKEDNIRIEALPNGPQGAKPSARPSPEDRDYSNAKRKPSYKEKSWNDKSDSKPYQGDKPRYEGKPKFDGPAGDRPPFKKPRADKPPYIAKAKREGGEAFAKPAFGKKNKG